MNKIKLMNSCLFIINIIFFVISIWFNHFLFVSIGFLLGWITPALLMSLQERKIRSNQGLNSSVLNLFIYGTIIICCALNFGIYSYITLTLTLIIYRRFWLLFYYQGGVVNE